MIKGSLIFIIAIICISQIHSQTVTLPVSQTLVTKLSLSIQKLEQLLACFGTRNENKFQIYQRVMVTKCYLDDLSKALAQYNNVIVGAGNAVNGTKNIVIGNYNNINGNHNWVFVSKFTGNATGDLLIGQWRIEMEKANLILINTRFAISYLDEEKNRALKNRYNAKNRQFCKWDKWTNPNSQKSDSHWKRYQGYGDWRSNEWEKVANSWNGWLTSWGNWGNSNMLGAPDRQQTTNNQQNSWGGSWGSWGR